MATRNFRYDHPAYLAVLPVGLGVTVAGASAITGARFTAFTDTLVKSITMAVVTAGTSTTHIMRSLLYRGGTSTDTAILTTLGSSGFANVVSTLTMTQGDSLAILQGSDATMVSQAGAELAIIPGSNVTQ